ncbi:MAG: MATE family efflux transporter, partial [Anaerovoracaceae bacterium]
MTSEQNLNNIKNRELLGMLGKVALPIALQSLIGSSLNLVDNLMVGSLGELELNAVGVAVQIFFIYWMLLYGFSGGAATFISQYFGVKDFANIRKTTGFAVTVAISIGLVFFIVAELFPRQILGIFTR